MTVNQSLEVLEVVLGYHSGAVQARRSASEVLAIKGPLLCAWCPAVNLAAACQDDIQKIRANSKKTLYILLKEQSKLTGLMNDMEALGRVHALNEEDHRSRVEADAALKKRKCEQFDAASSGAAKAADVLHSLAPLAISGAMVQL